MASQSMSTSDKIRTLLALPTLPFAILAGLVRRLVTGSDGKSLIADLLLTTVRWSTALPLSIKRSAISVSNVDRILSTPRLRLAKHELCQYVKRDDFSGYWLTQGPLDGEAAPSKCDIVLLWLHGGAYVLGTPLQALVQVARVTEILSAHGVKAATFGMEYGLAPEATFPTPFEQGLAAYRYILEQVPAEKIVICGESAGGHLSLSVLDNIYKNKLPKPGYALLQYPWVDLTNSGKSVIRNKHNDMLDAGDLNQAVQWACNGDTTAFKDILDFSASKPSPYWSKVLPKTWVGIGSHDLFVDSVQDFVNHAKEDGCDVTLDIWPNAPHGWPAIQDALGQRQYLRLQPGDDVGTLTPGSQTIADALLGLLGKSTAPTA